MTDDRRCLGCGVKKSSAEFPGPSVSYCYACGVMPCYGDHHDGEHRPFAEWDDLSERYCRRCAWKVCRQCGERKPFAEFIKGTGRDYCRACGLVLCRGCGKVKPVSEYAAGQESGWHCRECGSAVCGNCGRKLPLRDFRDPTQDPTCRDCEVRRFSEQERAILEREEQDYRRRVRQGHRPTDQELRERQERRAALVGTSPRGYRHRTDFDMQGCGYDLLSASLVVVIAIGYWVYAVLDGPTAAGPALLAIPITVLVFYGWQELWCQFVYPAPAYQDFMLWSAERNSAWYDVAALGLALVVPVLSYLLVLALVTVLWP